MNYHDRGIIAGNLKYAVCSSKKTYRKEMARLKIANTDPAILPGSDATVHYFDTNNGQNIAIVCISKLSNHLNFMGLLAHEAYHIHRYNMQLIREDAPGEEVSAYCIQMILQRLIDEVAEVKLKFRRL